jgi:hypothetical protein
VVELSLRTQTTDLDVKRCGRRDAGPCGAPWWAACSPPGAFYFKPQAPTQQVEVRLRGLTELMTFEGIFSIALPAVEHVVVDCFVGQGAVCCDAECKNSFRTEQKGLRVDLYKKRSGESAVRVPYDEQGDDFEMLVVHVPDDPTHKFFIPAADWFDAGTFAVPSRV